MRQLFGSIGFCVSIGHGDFFKSYNTTFVFVLIISCVITSDGLHSFFSANDCASSPSFAFLCTDDPHFNRHGAGLQRPRVLRPHHALLSRLAPCHGERDLLHRHVSGISGVKPLPHPGWEYRCVFCLAVPSLLRDQLMARRIVEGRGEVIYRQDDYCDKSSSLMVNLKYSTCLSPYWS